MSGFFSGREDSGGARDAYHRGTEILEATWACARLHVIPFSREDAKRNHGNRSSGLPLRSFASSREPVSEGARRFWRRETLTTETPRTRRKTVFLRALSVSVLLTNRFFSWREDFRRRWG